MKRRTLATVAVAAALVGLSGCGSMGSSANLFQQLGGMDTVNQLASSMLSSSMQDPRLSGLLGGVNKEAASPKLADQLCSALGGGCSAPYTNDQVTAAANKLNPAQTSAVSDNFKTALNSITSNPAVREAVTKSLGSKMGGIVGALI